MVKPAVQMTLNNSQLYQSGVEIKIFGFIILS